MNSRLRADTLKLNEVLNLTAPFGNPDVAGKIVFIPNSQKNDGIWTPQALESQRRNGVMIHSNQVAAAREIIHELERREYIPQLVAQPGQGKSGTVTKVMEVWLTKQDSLQLLTSEPSVAWITMLNDNEVRDQGDIDYLEPSHMTPYVQTYHVGNLTDCDTLADNIVQMTNFRGVRGKNVKSHPVLLLLDEIHLGLAKNGNLDKKLLDRIGANLHSPPNQWENQSVFIVGVSATALPQDICKDVYKIILLSKDPAYLSLEEMLDQGRLHDNSAKNFYSKRKYQNLKSGLTQVATRWYETRNWYYGDVFYGKDEWTIRCKSISDVHKFAKVIYEERNLRRESALIDPIMKYGYDHLSMVVFHHKHNRANSTLPFLEERSIKEFAPMLLKPSFNKGIRVYFIIHAARAGKTIRNPYGIRWDDTSGKQTDTVVQSAGRGPGYHKENEDYHIYVNLGEVKKYIVWYKAIESDTPHARSERPDTTGAHTRLSNKLWPSAVELVYTPDRDAMDVYRIQYEYPTLAELDNRMVRSLTTIGTKTDRVDSDFHTRIMDWFDQLVGKTEAYVSNNEETMKKNASVYYIEPNWNGRFSDLLETHYAQLVNQYRPTIQNLYATYGPGYYWWRPTAFHDRPELSPNAILNKPKVA